MQFIFNSVKMMFGNFYSVKRWNDAGNCQEECFQSCDITKLFGTYLHHLDNNLVFYSILFYSIHLWYMKSVFFAEIWLVKTSTRIGKYKSRVITSNPSILLSHCIFLKLTNPNSRFPRGKKFKISWDFHENYHRKPGSVSIWAPCSKITTGKVLDY